MANMTPRGRYLKGLDLEQEGMTAAQIALELGFKSVSAWYSFKSYHTKKAADFVARAAGKPDEPKPNPIVEEVNKARQAKETAAMPGASSAHRHTEVWTDPVKIIFDKPKPKLQRVVQVSAQGESCSYKLIGDVISINRLGQHRASLSLTINEYMTMTEEVKELLKP